MAIVVSAPTAAARKPSGRAEANTSSDITPAEIAAAAELGIGWRDNAFQMPQRPTLSLLAPDLKLQLRRASGPLFSNGPSPHDLRQGALGDCYFISALSAVAARRPDIIRNMVKQIGPNVYRVRLYDLTTGRPTDQVVTGDVFIKADGTPAYARSLTGETWPLIVEKALAARFGGYEAIRSGTAPGGLAMVTGMKTRNIDPQRASEREVWEALLNAKARNAPMSAGITQASLDKCKVDSSGLAGNHAYTVLDAYSDRAGNRWVVVREPNTVYHFRANYQTQVLDAGGRPIPGMSRLKLQDFRNIFRNLAWTLDEPLEVRRAPTSTTRVRPAATKASEVQCYVTRAAPRPARRPPTLWQRAQTTLNRVTSWRPW